MYKVLTHYAKWLSDAAIKSVSEVVVLATEFETKTKRTFEILN